MLPSSRPIFIGGLFKSGTSLLRAMLGQHPHIATGLETYWFDIDWNELEGANSKERLRRIAAFYQIDNDEAEALARCSADVRAFLDELLGRHARVQGKRRWAEKTPGNVIYARRLFSLWPEAGLIHVVRDPRDVLASLRQARKWDDPDYFASMWCKFFGAVEEAKADPPWPEGNFAEIRYEELVTRPEQVMRRVIEFAGEPWHSDVSRFNGKTDDFDIVLQHTGKASTTLDRLRHPLEQGRVGLWSQVLTPEELDYVYERVKGEGLGQVYCRVIAETPAFPD